MIEQTKDQYISPESEVLEIKPEGVIATSPGGWEDGGELFG